MRGNREFDIDKNQKIYLMPQTFFQFIMNEDCDFLFIERLKEWVPNLSMLLRNRKKDRMYMVSGNIKHLVSAVHAGFCICPILNSSNDDHLLNLVELYFNNIKFKNYGRLQNLKDFEFLINDKQVRGDIERIEIRQSSEHKSLRSFNGHQVLSFQRDTGSFPLDIQNVIPELDSVSISAMSQQVFSSIRENPSTIAPKRIKIINQNSNVNLQMMA